MQAILGTFLSLDRCNEKLGSGPFRFDADRDMVVAGTDVKAFRDAHVLLRGYQATHRHAVVVLDYEFGHQMEPDKVVSSIQRNMVQAGWAETLFEVVLIQPELEVWIWQDNPLVQEVFYRRLKAAERERLPALRKWLCDEQQWPDGMLKPPNPKAAFERAQRAFRAGSSMAICTEIFQRVSVQGCTDPAFGCLRDALRRWFPRGGTGL